MDALVKLPKPEIKGIGHVQYRCASCGDLMEPEEATLVADKSYHPEHSPESPSDGL